MARDIVVVDVETNGLDLEKHQAFEVAWWNLTTDERGVLIPKHNMHQLLFEADIRALQINRYIDRIPDAAFDGRWMEKLDLLVGQLMGEDMEGATLAGSNPSFDAAMLLKLIHRAKSDDEGEVYNFDTTPVWHHRLWDLSAYAAGVLGLDGLPGLASVCDLLGIPAPDHTAEGDVTATGLCFLELRRRAAK